MSQSRLVHVPQWVERRFWTAFLLGTFSVFGVAETYALYKGFVEKAPVSEKAQFPTMSAHVWRVCGIYPASPRRYWTRPLLGVFLVWLTLHLLFMVPGPFEREVIERVRAKQVRRAKRSRMA